jgi:hypothetical protein
VGAVLLEPGIGAVVINETDIPIKDVFAAVDLSKDPVMADLVKWSVGTQSGGGGGRHGGMFERDRYITPENPFEQMKVAYDAAESDDVVSGVLESSEALAFSKMSVDTEEEDEANIWNQIMDDIDLDMRIREMWRELMTVSQFYTAVWFGRKSYKVQGKNRKTKVQRKKSFDNLFVPLGLTVLDPLKVIPVGNFLFNRERLCYIADRTEQDPIDSFLLNPDDPINFDPVIAKLITAKYEPDFRERKQLGNYGVDPSRLYLMNDQMVFRHGATRSQYSRFSTIRLKSIFELLDLKHQLRQMDRAHLIGATNFIVLIKKGTDKEPARQAEINNLQAQVRTVSRVPVIVGDHRLNIEIITPKTDNTLDVDTHAGLDERIASRLYGMFVVGQSGSGSRTDDSIKLARVVGRGLESHRFLLRRAIERNVFAAIYKQNAQFTNPAQIIFHPRRVSLDFDPAVANFLLQLRDRGDMSRSSILEEVDYDEADEARKREYEKEYYDDTFAPTNVPFSATGAPLAPGTAPAGTKKPGATKVIPPHGHAPDGTAVPLPPAKAPRATKTAAPTQDPKSAGRSQGGNNNGGGAAPGTGQGQPARNPTKTSDGGPAKK